MANARIGSHPSHGYQVVETITTTKQLDRNDSGKFFMVDNTDEYSIHLPKLSTEIAGWNCKFIVSFNGDNDVTVSPFGVPAAGGGTSYADADTVYYREFVTDISTDGSADGENESKVDGFIIENATVVNDQFEVFTDGTYWYVTATLHQMAHGTKAGS